MTEGTYLIIGVEKVKGIGRSQFKPFPGKKSPTYRNKFEGMSHHSAWLDESSHCVKGLRPLRHAEFPVGTLVARISAKPVFGGVGY